MGVEDVSSDGRLLFAELWPLVPRERERLFSSTALGYLSMGKEST